MPTPKVTIKKNDTVILGLSSNPKLAKELAKNSNSYYEQIEMTVFSDGEKTVKINSTVRSRTVYIVQSTNSPTSDNIIEVLLTVDAVKRASANEIILVMPYMGYARQDRRANGRQPISAKLFASLYEVAGATHMITFDLHSDQIEGFFDIPLTNLKAYGIIYNEFKKIFKVNSKESNLVVVSPDHGGVTRARSFAKNCNASLAIIDKRRTGPNQAESMHIIGEVKDKNVLIIDDIIDTGGTISSAIKLLKKNGAKKIYVAATHAILSPSESNKNPLKTLEKSGMELLITTNSIEKNYDSKNDKVKVVSLTKPLVHVIQAHQNKESITQTFIKKYNTIL